MTGFDYAVLAIIGLSVLLSVMRGLLKEILALVGWVVSFIVARNFTAQIMPLLPEEIPTEQLKTLAAFLILFLATLLVCSLLKIVLVQIVRSLGLGPYDRILGGLFGLFRGMLIVTILVMLAGFTHLPKDVRWRDAMFSAPLEALVAKLLPWLPEPIAKHISYD